MADSDVEPAPDWSNRLSNTAEDTFVAMEGLLTTLRALEATLLQQDISEISSTEYCDNFCQVTSVHAKLKGKGTMLAVCANMAFSC